MISVHQKNLLSMLSKRICNVLYNVSKPALLNETESIFYTDCMIDTCNLPSLTNAINLLTSVQSTNAGTTKTPFVAPYCFLQVTCQPPNNYNDCTVICTNQTLNDFLNTTSFVAPSSISIPKKSSIIISSSIIGAPDPTGAIIAGIFGSIAGVGVLAFISYIFFFYRRKAQAKPKTDSSVEMSNTAEFYAPDSKQFVIESGHSGSFVTGQPADSGIFVTGQPADSGPSSGIFVTGQPFGNSMASTTVMSSSSENV